MQNYPLLAPVEAFWQCPGAKTPPICTRGGVLIGPRCKTAIFLHPGRLSGGVQVQNRPLFAPGEAFWRGPGAKSPHFCTRGGVLTGFRCKTTPFLHLGRRSGGAQVQNHPLFAPGEAFWQCPGAKPPPFCTWGDVLAGFRCKTIPFLHLRRRSGGVQVQKHPLFAPVEAF